MIRYIILSTKIFPVSFSKKSDQKSTKSHRMTRGRGEQTEESKLHALFYDITTALCIVMIKAWWLGEFLLKTLFHHLHMHRSV